MERKETGEGSGKPRPQKAVPGDNSGSASESTEFMDDTWVKTWAPLPRPSPPAAPIEIKLHPVDVTEEDVRMFNEKGYWLAPKMLDDQDIALLRKELDRVFKGEVDSGASPYEYHYWFKAVTKHHNNSPDVRKINNAWWVNQAIRCVALSPEIGAIAAKLLDTPQIRLWHDQVFKNRR
jgi:hypothetical protein